MRTSLALALLLLAGDTHRRQDRRRYRCTNTATLLLDGRVLIAARLAAGPVLPAELYDAISGQVASDPRVGFLRRHGRPTRPFGVIRR